MSKYHQPLIPGLTYHLFSRAVGNEKLFLSTENYRFFLRKLKHHTAPVCKFYGYTLLPDQFHLLVRINEQEAVIRHFKSIKKRDFHPPLHDLSDFIMERFSNFLNGYTKAFNRMYHRKGSLFIDYLKRAKAETDEDFRAFLWYIHRNAVHYQYTDKVGQWPFDSYASILSQSDTSLLRQEILERFGNRNEYIRFHQQTICPKKLDLL